MLVCGGETEKNYFSKFNLDLGTIKVITSVVSRQPSSLVKRAIKEKNKSQFNQVWCLFDKDDFDCFEDAIHLARANGIRVASSNQAFELWYVLHFQRQDGPMHRDRYIGIIERKIGRPYRKPEPNIYSQLKNEMGTAIANAEAGYYCHKRTGKTPANCESYTTVFRLARELLK